MASSINASTSPAAIVQTADGTGILALQTGNTTAVTIDASQNVGIGSTPVNSRRLTLNTSTQTDLSIVAGSTNYAQLLFGYTGADNKGIISYYNNDNSMQFYTNASERMRIDSSGNLLFNSGYGSAAVAYGCRAWVNFNGTGTVAIRGSGNVSSITDNGTGDYTVNFTTAMPDVNFGFTTGGDRGAGAGETRANQLSFVSAKDRGTGYVRLATGGTNTTPSIVAPEDQLHVCVAIFR